MAALNAKAPPKVAQRVLIVDDEPAILDFFRDLVAPQIGCRMSFAASLSEARAAVESESYDLLIVDIHLPDGDGMTLIPDFQHRHPAGTALVISGQASMHGVIHALRCGAADFIPKPITLEVIAERVRKALLAARLLRCQHRRFNKLKDTVKRLNAARKLVTKKVDLLCNDLITAYGDLSKQVETVRIQESYRQFIDQSGGLEQLLCHSMDWLLRQVGYCNIGIWLTTADHELQLGAFMKYTTAAEQDLVEALQKNLLRLAIRRGFLRMRAPDEKSSLTPIELKYLATQDIIAVNCTYLGESLGVITLFRDHKTSFSDDDVTALKTVTPLFALALAKAVRGVDGPDELSDDAPKPKSKKDPADWWKNGEAPPF